MSENDRSQKSERRSSHAGGRLFFTGFSMGLADLVPGVSGGTVAFLFGIYDELLYSIKVVTGSAVRSLLKGNFTHALAIVPFGFLVPLMLGILAAIFGMVQLVSYALDNFPVYIWSLFFGLVLSSAFVISKRINGWNAHRIGLCLLGFVLTYVLVGLPTLSTDVNPISMFLTGAVAITAMILPGISGSLIMVILGQYENVIRAVADRDVITLGFFAVGAIVSIALFSRLLSWLLRNHHSGTIAFLIGVLIGSLRKVWPWQISETEKTFSNYMPEISALTFAALIFMVIGFLIVWQLEKIGIAKEHVDIDSKEFEKEVRTQHD